MCGTNGPSYLKALLHCYSLQRRWGILAGEWQAAAARQGQRAGGQHWGLANESAA